MAHNGNGDPPAKLNVGEVAMIIGSTIDLGYDTCDVHVTIAERHSRPVEGYWYMCEIPCNKHQFLRMYIEQKNLRKYETQIGDRVRHYLDSGSAIDGIVKAVDITHDQNIKLQVEIGTIEVDSREFETVEPGVVTPAGEEV